MNMSNNSEINDSFDAMGTEVSLKIILKEPIKETQIAKIKKTARKIFKENKNIFSRFDKNSELSLINKKKGQKIGVSKKMLEILLLCKKFHQISGGYFDPRILENLKKIGYQKDFRTNKIFFDGNRLNLEKIEEPLETDLQIFEEEQQVLIKKEIDTTGIVKGHTVDLVAQFLLEEGFENFIVDAGGDMSIQGLNLNNEKWKIGIEDVDDEKILLGISGGGLATSGINRKQWMVGGKTFHHLINPKNPNKFDTDLKTVTVIREKTVEADGRAKTLYLMGREVGLKFANKNKIKALFLDYQGNVYLSEEIKKDLV